MKTMKWLLRREFWEHKGALLWAPVVAAALMITVFAATIAYAMMRVRLDGKSRLGENLAILTKYMSKLPPEKAQAMIDNYAASVMVATAPLFLMLSVTAFFYCMSALHDERRDRSILFWKSLPVSDTQTVLSKVLTAVIVAPLITIAIATFVSLILVMGASAVFAFYGLYAVGPLSNTAFLLAPLRVAALLPVYVLWALPTVGWLLLVSAWARSKPFLWGVVAPVLLTAILKSADYLLGGANVDWFTQHVLARGLLGLIPGIWLPLDGIDSAMATTKSWGNAVSMESIFVQSWLTLTRPAVWIGAAAGVAMIYGAARVRRWKDEG